MRKPIEPGCLAKIVNAQEECPYLNGAVVTVIYLTDLQSRYWRIDSERCRSFIKERQLKAIDAREDCLQRIDDGDFDPAADGEDNPYTMSVPNVWAPARQV